MANNKKNFFNHFWKREWFSFSLVCLILFSSYAFYLSFPKYISLTSFNLLIPSYLLAFLLPFILLLNYLYFLFFFRSQFSLKDKYNLRDISLGFLALTYFSFSLHAISFPINLSLWLFLFLGFFLIYLGGLFLNYKIINHLISKTFILCGFLFALLAFFNIKYQLIAGALIVFLLSTISFSTYFFKKD